ncbi:MAG TPA: ORF6N domain-containing protein [Chthoniobacteraceae bacterium]|nr:ORF6N domain-containing protein [Chthoniobacteraceae bacterium]
MRTSITIGADGNGSYDLYPPSPEAMSKAAIAPRIYTVRNEAVVLDSDLAVLYGVPTKRFNEQFGRNRHRFPADFAFRLTGEEFRSLRSQFATLKPGGRGQHRKYLPWVFTEHGAIMAATILSSDRAVAMSVYVVRAFVKMRRELLADAALEARLERIDKALLSHDAALRDLYAKLRPLLLPPAVPPKRPRIGFHSGDEKS